MREKSKNVNIAFPPRVYEMLVAYQKENGFPSVSQAVQGAVRVAYDKSFPRYQNKPTPIPVGIPGGGQIAQQLVIKERVKAKKQESELKDQLIIDNGKKVCSFLVGDPVGLGGPISEAACRAPILMGAELKPRAFPITFQSMPVMLDDDINNDERTKIWVFEQLFNMTLDEDNEKILKDQLEARVSGLVRGHKKGLIANTDIHPAMIAMLAENAERFSIDTSELRSLYLLQ